MEQNTFEKAFARLEEILRVMNDGKASLDESIGLYMEADKLIGSCGKKLSEAEQKIEVLIKNREGSVQMNNSGAPTTTSFDKHDEVPF